MKDVIKLSEAFSNLISQSISQEELDQVNELNQDILRNQCATMEFCLSPLLMEEAFNVAFNKNISNNPEKQTEEDNQLWAMAWMYSRINSFKSQRELCLITLN